MSISNKYNRTFHFDFSPGTTSDDKINHDWRADVQAFNTLVHNSKLDGENTCLSELGVFARSHAAPTLHPWADHLKIKQSMIKMDLKENNFEIFGENVYAVHSIIYPELRSHFYVFGIRCLDKWLSWEEVKWNAEFFDLSVVPELAEQGTTDTDAVKKMVMELAGQPEVFGSIDTITNEPCTREGIVSRNVDEYLVDEFSLNVFKYVRASHVKTDEHWSKNWKRASLIWEQKK